MIRSTLAKAILAGIGILILGQMLYVGVLVKINQYEVLRFVLLAFPTFAAFIAAYLAPRRKLVVGISMAIFGASISMLSALAYEYFGFHVDHIGGLLATFLILLAYNAAFCVVGSLAGYFLSRKMQRRKQA
jgi:hypothetical protein